MDTENEVKFICPNCMSVVARVVSDDEVVALPKVCKHCNAELVYKGQEDIKDN
jgi:predicted RNA-binding Zn-ribbon protein involved in translation (DUF1610 family)